MSIRSALSDIYDRMQRRIAPGLRHSQDIYEETLQRYMTAADSWLDLGCGKHILPPWRGELEQQMVAGRQRVVGMDYDLASLKQNRSTRLRCRASAAKLPFADDSFDLITANMVMEHLRDPRTEFREIHRVLAPGGRLIFHTPHVWGYPTVLSRIVPSGPKKRIIRALQDREPEDVFPTYYRSNSKSAIGQLAEASRLNIEECRLTLSQAMTAIIPPLAAVELVLLRLMCFELLSFLRPNIVAVLRKPSQSAPSVMALSAMNT